ncbi:MAG: histidinol-phosphatase HisJ family protein [Oscillospiraceae bacterium]|nr:histidinol-phosphatase HisJ family protein [Oscillospiraceae bacterium]
MFDYHMHSRVSFDGKSTGLEMAMAARERGLKEICFTDHIDYTPAMDMVLDFDVYAREYDGLEVPGLKIRRGVEYGLEPDNTEQMKLDLAKRNFDFVLGSVHLVEGVDVYMAPYWEGKTVEQAEREYLEEILRAVTVHRDYDVLGHLTYIAKARAHPTHELVRYEEHRELIDEILKCLVRHDKGMEVNTSGIDRCGGSLPTMDIFRRFHELGGRIVTIGSDAHDAGRVGQYAREMEQALKDIFGYVCTFENRQPIFHK